MASPPTNSSRFVKAQPSKRARLSPAARRTAEQIAVDTLRRAIMAGEIPGGTRLIQQDIAGELNISTTPVREALRVLAADGLVEFDPHRGAVVREVDDAEMREVVWLRCLLEPEAMRLAADVASDAALDMAESLAEQMERESDVATWMTLNREFHTVLCEASGARWLNSLLASLRSAAAIYLAVSLRVAPQPMSVGNAEHRALLEAIRGKDREEAARIALQHAQAVETTLPSPAESP